MVNPQQLNYEHLLSWLKSCDPDLQDYNFYIFLIHKYLHPHDLTFNNTTDAQAILKILEDLNLAKPIGTYDPEEIAKLKKIY